MQDGALPVRHRFASNFTDVRPPPAGTPETGVNPPLTKVALS